MIFPLHFPDPGNCEHLQLSHMSHKINDIIS